MPGLWPPRGSRGVFCIRRHPLPKANRRSCPDVLGEPGVLGLHPRRGKAGGEVRISETCLGLGLAPGSTRGVLVVAGNAPFLASLPTTPDTPTQGMSTQNPQNWVSGDEVLQCTASGACALSPWRPSPPSYPSLAKTTILLGAQGRFLGAWRVECLPLGSTHSPVPGSVYKGSVD